MIDIYCERVGPGLWAEPVNALTNLAFILAALASWRLARQHGRLRVDIVLLIALVAAIGIGSSLFHTFANRWSAAADVIPILLFQMLFIGVYGR